MTTPASGTTLDTGDLAPDFTLTDQAGTEVSLSALLEQREVLVVFYPFAFSGVCTGELSEIRDNLGDFDNERVSVVTVSCDPMYSLRAWADQEGYFFPLLSDFWPHGRVAEGFGVLDGSGGFAHRGTFLVGQDSRVRWRLVSRVGEGRDFSGFRELTGGGACAG